MQSGPDNPVALALEESGIVDTIEALQENWDQVIDSEGLVLAASGAEDTVLFDVGFDEIGMTRLDPDKE